MTEPTIMLRVPAKLVHDYQRKHKELKGLNYTAIVEVMLRKALEAEA